MNNKYLIEDLRDFKEWAESNIYEVPIDLRTCCPVLLMSLRIWGSILRFSSRKWRPIVDTLSIWLML